MLSALYFIKFQKWLVIKHSCIFTPPLFYTPEIDSTESLLPSNTKKCFIGSFYAFGASWSRPFKLYCSQASLCWSFWAQACPRLSILVHLRLLQFRGCKLQHFYALALLIFSTPVVLLFKKMSFSVLKHWRVCAIAFCLPPKRFVFAPICFESSASKMLCFFLFTFRRSFGAQTLRQITLVLVHCQYVL